MAIKPLTKAELIAAVTDSLDGGSLGPKNVDQVIMALSSVVTETVAGGGAVTLPGIGKIEGRQKPARTVRNPQTGQSFVKEAHLAPRMVFAKALKTACDG